MVVKELINELLSYNMDAMCMASQNTSSSSCNMYEIYRLYSTEDKKYVGLMFDDAWVHTEQHWKPISGSDWPEEGQVVLVTFEASDGSRRVFDGFWRADPVSGNREWYLAIEAPLERKIIAWQYKPEPYGSK